MEFVLSIEPRTEQGSAASRRIRRSGQIPCVIYSHGKPPHQGKIVEKEFVRIGSVARSSQIFKLKSSSDALNGGLALVKDVQKDTISSRVLHVDLVTIRDDEYVRVEVPVKFVGEAHGVKNEGGILTIVFRHLLVECFPKDLPSELLVDISGLHLGESLHARAVPMPEGVRLLEDPEETVVSVVTTRVVEEETAAPTAAAGATAEGAAAPAAGAAGEAAAAAAPAAADAKKAEGKK